jgi:hypothetical protein
MKATELALKSPAVPLFQRGNFLRYCFNPSLEKHALSVVEGRGRGDFWGVRRELFGELIKCQAGNTYPHPLPSP